MPRSFLFTAIGGFCGGIVLAEFFVPSFAVLTSGLLVGAAVASRRRPRLIGIGILALAIGMIRWNAWIGEDVWSEFIDQRVLVAGTVVDTPTPRFSQQEFELVDLRVDERSFAGKISVRMPEFPPVTLGERLSIGCTVTAFFGPNVIRQRLHDVRGYCKQPEIFDSVPADWSVRLGLGRAKAWAVDRITQTFVEPQSSLLVGILLGRQVQMPAELNNAFQVTGTTHIIALSGFNVTIIITAISAVLIALIGRRWAWIPALVFVIGFILMTGASASVTRAGVMASLVLLALRLGRPISMVRLLGYVLVLMVWHNPLVLLHDLGFQLSFLATAGLVYVAPAVQLGLHWLPGIFSLRENLGTTMGAILMTQPLLLWHFGRVSLVAPLVNMLILPMIPLAMTAGFVSLLVPPLWPAADGVLRLIIRAIEWGARLPFALQELEGAVVIVVGSLISFLAIQLIGRTNALQTVDTE